MSSDVLLAAVQIAALLFAVSVHESAHGWVAWRCGDPTARELGRISLNPMRHIDPVGSILVPGLLALSGAPVFGWAKPVPISLARTRDPRSAQLLISAAGPLSNVLLALLFLGSLAVLLRSPAFVEPLADTPVLQGVVLFLWLSVGINVVLAVFNLLPIPPLDGFGVLESLLPASWWPLTRALRRYDMIALLLLVVSGGLSWVVTPILRAVRGLLGA